MNKIFLFDLGGVLLQPMDNHKLYENLNCKISYEEFEHYWFSDKTVIDAHKGLVTDEFHIEELLKYIGSNLTIKDFYDIYNELSQPFYSDTIEMIKTLKAKHYRVGILSNLRLMDYNNCSTKLDELDLDFQFLSYEMKCLKPDKEIYELVIQECNCNPNDIIFFDDNIKNVNGAKECGINAYVATGENMKEVFKNKINIDHK